MTKSQYVEVVNTMLMEAESGATLYVLENGASLEKLLHHPDSAFGHLLAAGGIAAKVFTFKNAPVDELKAMGIEVFVMPEYQEQHLTVLDVPTWVWYEGKHKDGSEYAHDIVYTDSPYEHVMQQFLDNFSKMEERIRAELARSS